MTCSHASSDVKLKTTQYCFDIHINFITFQQNYVQQNVNAVNEASTVNKDTNQPKYQLSFCPTKRTNNTRNEIQT